MRARSAGSGAWKFMASGDRPYGAVVVPILHEFHPDNIEHLVTHSGARLLFSEQSIFENLDEERMPTLEGGQRPVGAYASLYGVYKLNHVNVLLGTCLDILFVVYAGYGET